MAAWHGTLYAGNGNLAVEVRRKGGDSIFLQVLAPPQPSIAAVKTLLRAKDPTISVEKTILSTSQGGEPLDDRSALTRAKGLAATGFACVDGCSRALVLYSRTDGASDQGSSDQQQLQHDRQEVQERKRWKKVPIRRGDSLQKLSLKYNLPVSLIKSSNNIVGAEIEAWRDELWLPPSAVEGQKLKRPTNKIEEFFWLLKGEGEEEPSARAKGMQVSLPSREEVQVYLDMNQNDVEEAVKAWEDDMDWEDEQQLPDGEQAALASAIPAVLDNAKLAQAQADTQLQVRRILRESGIQVHVKTENPMNAITLEADYDDDL